MNVKRIRENLRKILYMYFIILNVPERIFDDRPKTGLSSTMNNVTKEIEK